MTMKKISPIRFSWLRDRNNATTLTLAEMRNMSLKRRDCGGDTANPSAALMETTEKKRACIRKDCEGDTSTAMETSRRKDCGCDTANPSAAVMEIPPIRFSWLRDRNNATTLTLAELRNTSLKRIDCGGDIANTSATAEKNRACRREDCEGDATADTMSTVIEIKKKRAYRRRKKYLPHDLIVEQILTRLPVPSLLKSVLVSKLWYNSIHTDRKRFTHSHFLQSKKQPRVIFSLLDVRDGDTETTGEATYGCHFFKFTNGLYGTENPLKYDSFPCYQTHNGISELVGYCNGLPCMAFVGDYSTGYVISDPNRKDHLYIFYPAYVGKHISNAHIICHGFGFDSSANEYKVVSIFRTPQKELNFVVFTLGTKSWRDVTDTTTLISGYGCPITKIRAPTGSDKSAIFCAAISSSGCLVWKIIATLGGAGSNHIQHDSEMEMLLSFNLHDEKFQLIQLPAKSTTDEQQKHLHVDYPHLLEFKGSPCIARIQKN
ncbi:hypothetical protein MKW92_050740 [Papaver armeniacum]|nr:hypothetical protein MKW92_050740 [Papaver armeniacum]